ncbi:MAG: hypothetical protein IH605_04090 [Burkholderiales bacterium]|nr:hypothetical protein [Burkholderiales bacterium]
MPWRESKHADSAGYARRDSGVIDLSQNDWVVLLYFFGPARRSFATLQASPLCPCLDSREIREIREIQEQNHNFAMVIGKGSAIFSRLLCHVAFIATEIAETVGIKATP